MDIRKSLLPIVAVVLVAISILLWRLSRLPQINDKEWFYDLNTLTLFVGKITDIPPIAAPSGDLRNAPPGTRAGVLATVIRVRGDPKPRVVFLKTHQMMRNPAGSVAFGTHLSPLLIALPPAKVGDPIQWKMQSKWTQDQLLAEMDKAAGGREYTMDLP